MYSGLGDEMSVEDIHEMMRECGATGGRITFDNFRTAMNTDWEDGEREALSEQLENAADTVVRKAADERRGKLVHGDTVLSKEAKADVSGYAEWSGRRIAATPLPPRPAGPANANEQP